MAAPDGGFESGQVGFEEIALRRLSIESMPRRLRAAVNYKMLRARHGLDVLRIVSLQPANECHGHLTSQERVLTIRFLAAAPPRVAKNINIRRPECQAFVAD